MIATLDMPVDTAVGMLRQGENGWDILTILDSIVTESPEPGDVDGYTGECDVDMDNITAVWDDDVNELMYVMENDYNDDVE